MKEQIQPLCSMKVPDYSKPNPSLNCWLPKLLINIVTKIGDDFQDNTPRGTILFWMSGWQVLFIFKSSEAPIIEMYCSKKPWSPKKRGWIIRKIIDTNHWYQIKSNEWETVSGERFCSGLDSRKPARHMVTRHDMIMTMMMRQYIPYTRFFYWFTPKVFFSAKKLIWA